MAKQEPQQPFFIPRVAGVTPPSPKPPQPEVQAPPKAVFRPTVAPPPPKPQPQPEVKALGEAAFEPTVTAPPPPLQLKPEVPSAGEAAFQPTVAPPPLQPKPVVPSAGEAAFQPTVAAPPPQLKPVVQAPAEAMFQPTAATPPPPQVGRTPFPAPAKRQGRKGILIAVLAGLFLCVALGAMVALTPSLRQKVQELAAPQKSGTNVEVTGSSSSKTAPQSPPVYPEGASRVEEKEIGFSFAVPQGYLAASEEGSDNLYLFERKLFTEPKRTVLIRKVSGNYPQGAGTGADLSSLLDGRAVSTVTFDWRGRALEGSRSLDPNPAKPFAVFTVVIPLHEQRVLLEVGGAVESEAVIREVMDQVLASLSEDSK